MKKIFFLLGAILCTSFSSIAQHKVKPHELIISLPFVEKEKTLPLVIDLVTKEAGVKAVAYCEDFRCLLIQIDANHPEMETRVLENLKSAHISFDIKTDATIQRVLSESKKIINAETNWQ